jgi:hypothetical protein
MEKHPNPIRKAKSHSRDIHLKGVQVEAKEGNMISVDSKYQHMI